MKPRVLHFFQLFYNKWRILPKSEVFLDSFQNETFYTTGPLLSKFQTNLCIFHHIWGKGWENQTWMQLLKLMSADCRGWMHKTYCKCWYKILNTFFSESHVMMIGQEEAGQGRVRFISLSPEENPLPACLAGAKNPINVGNLRRRRPALFPSTGIYCNCQDFSGNCRI